MKSLTRSFASIRMAGLVLVAGSWLPSGRAAAATAPPQRFDYRGEGVMLDNSRSPWRQGYRLILPTFPLSQKAEATYHLGPLPDLGPGMAANVYFTLEFSSPAEFRKYSLEGALIAHGEALRQQEMDSPQSIEVSVETQDGKRIYSESLILGASIWTTRVDRAAKVFEAACYPRGRLSRADPFRPFFPLPGQAYLLRVRFDPRARPLDLKAHVQIWGGPGE